MTDHETEQARRRLRRALAWADDHGIQAGGVIGDPIDPLAAVVDRPGAGAEHLASARR